MKALFVSAAAVIGAVLATIGTAGCIMIFIDEPEMPKYLIEK